MTRQHSKEADKYIDKKISVLDKGHIMLVDYIGTDQRIVDSARVSYSSGKTIRSNKQLINYLMINEHWSPFEQVSFTFIVKLPIFLARQWMRHRAFKYNEISGRYSVLEPEAYVPDLNRIQKQSSVNKQGSEGSLRENEKIFFRTRISSEQKHIYSGYKTYIEKDIARELSRINLPLSQYTEFYCTADLRNLFNFLKLRLDHHAQWEIAEYGRAMVPIVKAVVPIAYDAFSNHILNVTKFSKDELEMLKKFVDWEEMRSWLDHFEDKETNKKSQLKVMKSIKKKLS